MTRKVVDESILRKFGLSDSYHCEMEIHTQKNVMQFDAVRNADIRRNLCMCVHMKISE